MTTRKRLLTLIGGALASLLGLLPGTSAAQTDFPSKPIRWVVPSPAGSPVDAIARRLAQAVGQKLKATIVVDDKPGASGTIGAAEVARAPADGYTCLFTVGDPLISALSILKSLPYDPQRDFTFISKVAANGPVLVAHAGVKANDLAELVAQAKAASEPTQYGSWGPGTLPVQVMESVARQAGIKLREVPYRGSPPALQDVLGSQIPMTFTAPHIAAPFIAQGKLKALAVVGPQRSSVLPAVKTFEESGFKGFVFTNEIWVGLLAPAKLDEAVRKKLEDAVRASLQEADLRKFLSDAGFAPIGSSAEQFAREYGAEVAVIPGLIKDLGVVPQ